MRRFAKWLKKFTEPSVFVNLVMAIITLLSVLLVRETLNEMKYSREQAYRPELAAKITHGGASLYDGLEIAVTNIGLGAARQIKVEVSDETIQEYYNVLLDRINSDTNRDPNNYALHSMYKSDDERMPVKARIGIVTPETTQNTTVVLHFFRLLARIDARAKKETITDGHRGYPDIELNISYQDTFGKTYSQTFTFSVVQTGAEGENNQTKPIYMIRQYDYLD